jgi:ribose-phosphate pyrophosphokinase
VSVILSFPQYQSQARQLADSLGLPFAVADIHHFPDQESRVTLPLISIEHTIVYCGLEHPNNKLIELLLMVETLREYGCNKTSLVAPYLCYMRQDIAFNEGEAVSQKIIGQYLANLFDNLITVDAHLHRSKSLELVFPGTNAIHISAAPLFGDFLKQQNIQALLLGPDEESQQWVQQIAEPCALAFAAASKTRHDDQHVTVQLPEHDFNGKDIVLVDDVISSGGTLIEITRQLKQSGAKDIYAMVTHALYDDDTAQKLEQAGIKQLWSSDSIPHKTNAVSIVPLIAQQLKNWLG